MGELVEQDDTAAPGRQGPYPPGIDAIRWDVRLGGQVDAGTVLRQAMATDGGMPAGIYFGSNSGSIFASFDEGESWNEIARHLPTVLSVEVM